MVVEKVEKEVFNLDVFGKTSYLAASSDIKFVIKTWQLRRGLAGTFHQTKEAVL